MYIQLIKQLYIKLEYIDVSVAVTPDTANLTSVTVNVNLTSLNIQNEYIIFKKEIKRNVTLEICLCTIIRYLSK